MKPAPPVTSSRRGVASRSAILAAPVVGNAGVIRRYAEFVGLGVDVMLGRRVDEIGGLGADSLHAVEDQRRDHQQDRVVLAHEELVDLAPGGALLARRSEEHTSELQSLT